MTDARRFFIGSDGSHEYIVPLDRITDWRVWREGEGKEDSDFDLGVEPDYAQRIDGGTLTFTNPKIERLP